MKEEILNRKRVIEVLNPFMDFAKERLYNRIAGNNQVVLAYNGKKLLFQDLVNVVNLYDELCDAGEREETISLERAIDFASYQYYRGSIGKPFLDFEDWEVKTKQREERTPDLCCGIYGDEPPIKDIPPECRSCGHRNSESCNTCMGLNP